MVRFSVARGYQPSPVDSDQLALNLWVSLMARNGRGHQRVSHRRIVTSGKRAHVDLAALALWEAAVVQKPGYS